MDTGEIMDGISREILMALKAMKKAKTPEDKKTHSETVKNLTESLGVFLNLMNNMAYMDGINDDLDNEFDEDDQEIPF